MKTTILIGFLMVALTTARQGGDIEFEEEADEVVEQEATAEIDTNINRAASREVNCNCQCSSITFLDRYGQVNGNCRSADASGALWCYVDPRYSQCADLRRSTRTTSLWSYQACATPDLYSALCGGYSPAVGNGFGSGAVPAGGLPNLVPGPEGFPFHQTGGYPGINAGNGNLGNPVGDYGSYPVGIGESGYPSGLNNHPNGYPNLVDLLGASKKGEKKEEKNDQLIFT
jgi:hypothetical protein